MSAVITALTGGRSATHNGLVPMLGPFGVHCEHE
jgi:hypothetical protein